jgi:hypothetical protein
MGVDEFNLTAISSHIKKGDKTIISPFIQNKFYHRRYNEFELNYHVERYAVKTKDMSADDALKLMFTVSGQYFSEDINPQHYTRHDWFVCTLSKSKSTKTVSICSVHYIGNNIPGHDRKLLVGSINEKTKSWLKKQLTSGSLIRNRFIVVRCKCFSLDSFKHNLNKSNIVTSRIRDINQSYSHDIISGVDVLQQYENCTPTIPSHNESEVSSK